MGVKRMSSAALARINFGPQDWSFADNEIMGFTESVRSPVRVLAPTVSPKSWKVDSAPAWQSAVDNRLFELSGLARDWDGRGSAAVRGDALAFARQLLHQVMHPEASAPAIVPLGHGGVQISWESPRGEIDVEVYAPNRASIYALDAATQTDEEWDASADFSRLATRLASLAL